jgi:Matrixin
VHRLHLSRHAVVPAFLVGVVSLLASLGVAGADVTGSAGSATARAAVHQPVAAPDVRFALGGEAMTVARDIAQQHWGTAPCGGQVEIAWAQLDGETNATAAWRNPTDAWNNAGENFDCRIEFNAASDYDWPKLCTVMTHEMGHLVGQPHAANPGELMSPIYTDPLPACTGQEPGAPAPVAEAEPVAEPAVAVPSTSAAKKRVVVKRKPLKAAKRTARKAKGSKRCTRSFRAGRRSQRCVKTQRRAGRIARTRR